MANCKKEREFAYIYGLVDPRNDKVKYIGWCLDVKQRLRKHLCPSCLVGRTHKNNWIKLLLSLNLKPSIIVLEKVCINEWESAEIKWILIYGRENLTNSTDGGEGSLGCIQTKESIKKRTLKVIGIKRKGGWHHTEETKKILSENHKGILLGRKRKPFSEEHKRKLSEAGKKKILTEEHRKKISISNSGKIPSEETKQKLSKSLKGRVVSEETRKKISLASIGHIMSEETRAKISIATSGENNPLYGTHYSEETRTKISEKTLFVKNKNSTSKYLGVSFLSNKKIWSCYITYNKKSIYIGRFKTEIESAIAFNKKALELYGENAKLNIIEERR